MLGNSLNCLIRGVLHPGFPLVHSYFFDDINSLKCCALPTELQNLVLSYGYKLINSSIIILDEIISPFLFIAYFVPFGNRPLAIAKLNPISP